MTDILTLPLLELLTEPKIVIELFVSIEKVSGAGIYIIVSRLFTDTRAGIVKGSLNYPKYS